MKRRSVLLSDTSYHRLLRLKQEHGINISHSIEFLVEEFLKTLEEREQTKVILKKEAHSKLDILIEQLHRDVDRLM